MTTVFTICSINYLAQAKTLGESLLKFNPDYRYVIGLLDKMAHHEHLRATVPFELLEVEHIGIENFEEMYNNYEITELNTAVKPFYINYFLTYFPDNKNVIYLDPDIIVFDKFTHLENALKNNNIVLTPHFFTPIYDEYRLTEMDILNAGIYNLGFIAVSNTDEVRKFVDWWKIKLRKYCKIALCHGMFVDQLWVNFVPLYFDKVFILAHRGYNMAYWNLHERTLSLKEDSRFVNDTYPLIFYHYSGYSPSQPDVLSRHQNRFCLSERKDLISIFDTYRISLIKNGHESYSEINCYYFEIFKKRKTKEMEEHRMKKEIQVRNKQKLMPTIKRVVKRVYRLL